MNPNPENRASSRREDSEGEAATPTAGNSRPVKSNQNGQHPRLEERVRRHAETPWDQPLHAPSLIVFEELMDRRNALGRDRPLVFDTGCGTGVSTRRLAELHPEALVMGLDRSRARLTQVGAGDSVSSEGNAIWARIEMETFWRLALEAGWYPEFQYLLYPNPWPKSRHLMRRWHGHPIFPTLLRLGGVVELRSNWCLYLEEFQSAVNMLTGTLCSLEEIHPDPDSALTPFEAKYQSSGHALWRLQTIRLESNKLPKKAI